MVLLYSTDDFHSNKFSDKLYSFDIFNGQTLQRMALAETDREREHSPFLNLVLTVITPTAKRVAPIQLIQRQSSWKIIAPLRTKYWTAELRSAGQLCTPPKSNTNLGRKTAGQRATRYGSQCLTPLVAAT